MDGRTDTRQMHRTLLGMYKTGSAINLFYWDFPNIYVCQNIMVNCIKY